MAIEYYFCMDSLEPMDLILCEAYGSMLIHHQGYTQMLTPGVVWSFHEETSLGNELVSRRFGIQSRQYLQMRIDKFDLRSSGLEYVRSVLQYFLTKTKVNFLMEYEDLPLVLRKSGLVQLSPCAPQLKALHLDDSDFETLEHPPCFKAFGPLQT